MFNNTGFVRNFGTVYIERASGSSQSITHNINDGVTDFPIYKALIDATATGLAVTYSYDYICFLRAGDSLVCLLYTSPSPRDATLSRMPSSA